MSHPEELKFLKEIIGVNTVEEYMKLDGSNSICTGEDNIICRECKNCIIYNGKDNIITRGVKNSRILNCNDLIMKKSNCLALGNSKGEVEYIDLPPS